MLAKATSRDLPFPVTDRLESTLIEVGGLHDVLGKRLHLKVCGSKGDYPVTLTNSHGYGGDYPYFRAGKYLILSPELSCNTLEGSEPTLDVPAFLSDCKDIPEVVFLFDEKGTALQLNTSLYLDGYFLPNTVGCIIALQEIGQGLTGRTVVDIGSRNALLSNVALREGAENAIAIECESKQCSFLRTKTFPGINDNLDKTIEQVELNALLNRNQDVIERINSVFGKVAPREIHGGVAVFNFYTYGQGYYDLSSADLKQMEIRLGNGDLFSYDHSLEQRDSLFADVHKKFPGLEYIVASGGGRVVDSPHVQMKDRSQQLFREAERLGWILDDTVTVAHSVSGLRDREKIEVDLEFYTFIFKRG